jgi:MYXO-CTERM domain-containing protein
MRRYASFVALLVAAFASAPALVWGQNTTPTTTTGGLFPLPILIGDDDYNQTARLPINADQCDEPGLTVTFRLDNLPANSKKYIEAWVGSQCNSTDRLNTTKGDPCKQIASKEVATRSRIEIPLQLSDLCTQDGDRNIYFLSVGTLKSADTVDVWGLYTLSIDTEGPTAPTDVKGGSGQTAIPISWDATEEEVTEYFLVWDPAPGAGALGDAAVGGDDDDAGALSDAPSECASNLLFGNARLSADRDELPTGLRGKSIDKKVNKTTISASELGITEGYAAVGVMALDKALNESRVSNIVCVRATTTVGLWGAYKAQGGEVEPGCACSVPGESSAARPLAALPLLFAFAALWLRARRKRS